MAYLVLSILCSVLIANLLMAFNRRSKESVLPVFLGNYLVAASFSLISVPGMQPALPWGDLGLGVLTGAFFLANFWVYQRSIIINGLSLSVGVMRVAMIIVLGLAAFSLKADPKELHNFLWIVGLFLISGLTDASLKIYKELGSGQESAFVFVIFASAFVFTLLAILLGKLPLRIKSVLYGCVLGIPNRYSTVFFLKGLDSVPAALAYPLVAVSIVLLSIVCDIVIWKKRPSTRDALLWALLALSLVLLNLK